MTTSRRTWRAALRWSGYTLALMLLALAAVLGYFRWDASARESHSAAQLAPPTGRFVRAADITMYVQEQGEATAPPVIFVHGTGAWSEAWRDALTAVADAGFRAIALDLPPFGFSERPANKDYSAPAQARRILGLMDALGVEQAILVGHSFGGGPTMEAAFTAPERVVGLVLIDVALDIRSGTTADTGGGAVGTLLSLGPLRDAVVATFLTNPRFSKRLLQLFIADPAHATVERVAIYQKPLSLNGTTAALGEWLPVLLLPQPPSLANDARNYRELRVPTRVIWGAQDSVTPLERGVHLAELLPNAELSVMPGVGHIPQIENPDEFNVRLVDFLRSRQSAQPGALDEQSES